MKRVMSLNKRFDIILLDADDTLFDFKKCEYVAFTNSLKAFGIICTDEDVEVYSGINLSLWKQLEKGEIEREKLKTVRFDRFFDYLGVKCDSNAFSKEYVLQLSKCAFMLDGAVEFVRKLHKYCKIYIATNGLAYSQNSRMGLSEIKNDIDGMFISEEIGFAKPDKSYFDYIFNALNITDKSRVAIIGDSLSSDMLGGRNAGITTCQFNRYGKFTDSDLVDYRLYTYDDFWDILFENH